MKKTYIILLPALLVGITSCVKDEGHYELTPINEITISGIDKTYNKISYTETLSISPEVEATITGKDESQLEFQWLISDANDMSIHAATPISNEKKLEFPLDIKPGKYDIYFQVTDKTSRVKWEKVCRLNTLSLFVRGFYLFGDKEDGTCGMDFVSMLADRDTTVVEDIFTNSLHLKGAQNLIFTGPYIHNKNISLWAITQSGSHSIEFSSSLETFDIRKDINNNNLFFPTIEVTRPLKVMDIYPHPIGSANRNLAATSRVMMTENEIFSTSIFNDPEAYGNPISRYDAKSSILFKPSPYMFYQGNQSFIRNVMFFDETNHRFIGLNSGNFSFASNCMNYTKDDATPFYFDQTKYPSVRTLLYGENGYGNGGRSYALMVDTDKKYYIYGIACGPATPGKVFSRNIDTTIATNFDKASHYTFFSMQSIILYSAGSQLWTYDYNRNVAQLIQDFNSEITYLNMDYNSNDTPTDFIIATYNDSEKGIVRKFTLEDDQNNIKVTPHEKEVWKTKLKVVKVEYRNASI